MKIKNFFDDNFSLKTFLLIMILFVVVIFAIQFYSEINLTKEKMTEMVYEEDDLMMSVEDLFSGYLDDALNDLVYLDKIYDEKLIDGGNYDELVKEGEYFLEGKENYNQLRYIDKEGQELVRLNKKDSIITAVDKDELQNKADRYYFLETIGLKDKEIFITKLDLNIENGEIVTPYEPTIRLSTPVYDADGDVYGIIIINYDCSELLKQIEQRGNTDNNYFYVVDEEGFYLINDEAPKCWGFMYDRKDSDKYMFSYDFPEEWKKINSSNYQYLTDNWLTTVGKVEIDKEKNLGYTISTDAKFFIISQEKFGDGFYKEDDYLSILAYTFEESWWYLAILAIVSVFASMYYINRNETFREVKFFSEKDVLTGVYNRRKGVDLLQKKIDYVNKTNNNFSLCFIDINGLKQVNDTFGHVYGDELITTSTEVILETVRDSDIVCRMGGDEFIIIFDSIGKERAEEVWDRLVIKLDEINKSEEREYFVSLSHGIVDFKSNSSLTGDELIKLAYEKMYEEKKIIKKTFSSIEGNV